MHEYFGFPGDSTVLQCRGQLEDAGSVPGLEISFVAFSVTLEGSECRAHPRLPCGPQLLLTWPLRSTPYVTAINNLLTN